MVVFRELNREHVTTLAYLCQSPGVDHAITSALSTLSTHYVLSEGEVRRGLGSFRRNLLFRLRTGSACFTSVRMRQPCRIYLTFPHHHHHHQFLSTNLIRTSTQELLYLLQEMASTSAATISQDHSPLIKRSEIANLQNYIRDILSVRFTIFHDISWSAHDNPA